MISNFWHQLSSNCKFSIIATVIAEVLGFFSMGITGALIYTLVYYSFLPFSRNPIPHLDSLKEVWPTVVAIGILWPLAFILGAIAFHFMSKYKLPTIAAYTLYIVILWLWAFILVLLLSHHKW